MAAHENAEMRINQQLLHMKMQKLRKSNSGCTWKCRNEKILSVAAHENAEIEKI